MTRPATGSEDRPTFEWKPYTSFDPFTDPGRFGCLLDELPLSPASIRQALADLMLHVAWLPRYAVDLGVPPPRETLAISKRLALIQSVSPGPLTALRVPARRTVGTCRDFALLMCSALRNRGIEARVRCGFATYFSAGPFEDHWVCEYKATDGARWVRADPQIDSTMRDALKIDFDVDDLPVAAFLDASQAWQHMIDRRLPSDAFGHGAVRGLWFIRVNLERDLLALLNQTTSVWDGWRQALDAHRLRLGDEHGRAATIASEIADFARGKARPQDFDALARISNPPPWAESGTGS